YISFCYDRFKYIKCETENTPTVSLHTLLVSLVYCTRPQLVCGQQREMALTTTVLVLVFTLLYVSVELGQDDWGVTYSPQSICVLKGSTVELSCTYKYPSGPKVNETFWFTKEMPQNTYVNLLTDPNYSGRVTYCNYTSNHDNNNNTMRITDLRETDSAEYKFTFITGQPGGKWIGKPGVILHVTDLQVNMTPSTVTEGQTVTLTCITSCTLTGNPTYIWYKKNVTSPKASGQSYRITNITSEDSGEYYCVAGNTFGLVNSSTVFINVQYGSRNPSVSVSPSGEIVEGSSVTLTCSSDANPPVYNYTWYKKNVTSPKASGQSYSITNITSEDSGDYYCVAENVIGSNNSTGLIFITASPVKQYILIPVLVGITVAVLVLIFCLSGFIWFRKKTPKSVSDTRDKSDSGQGNSHPTYDNISRVGETSKRNDQQEEMQYASVNFDLAKTQDVPLYDNAQPPEQEEEVQYAAVKFNPPSAATKPSTGVAEEESPVLYSTVNTPRTKTRQGAGKQTAY
ncbi:hypothetical protein DPEC_G00171050, partial [Dallia pectoralis]